MPGQEAANGSLADASAESLHRVFERKRGRGRRGGAAAASRGGAGEGSERGDAAAGADRGAGSAGTGAPGEERTAIEPIEEDDGAGPGSAWEDVGGDGGDSTGGGWGDPRPPSDEATWARPHSPAFPAVPVVGHPAAPPHPQTELLVDLGPDGSRVPRTGRDGGDAKRRRRPPRTARERALVSAAHRVHSLWLLAGALEASRTADLPIVRGIALSLLPWELVRRLGGEDGSGLAPSPGRPGSPPTQSPAPLVCPLASHELHGIVTAWRRAIRPRPPPGAPGWALAEGDDGAPAEPGPGCPRDSLLASTLRSLAAGRGDCEESTVGFVAACRALGLATRLVAAVRPLPPDSRPDDRWAEDDAVPDDVAPHPPLEGHRGSPGASRAEPESERERARSGRAAGPPAPTDEGPAAEARPRGSGSGGGRRAVGGRPSGPSGGRVVKPFRSRGGVSKRRRAGAVPTGEAPKEVGAGGEASGEGVTGTARAASPAGGGATAARARRGDEELERELAVALAATSWAARAAQDGPATAGDVQVGRRPPRSASPPTPGPTGARAPGRGPGRPPAARPAPPPPSPVHTALHTGTGEFWAEVLCAGADGSLRWVHADVATGRVDSPGDVAKIWEASSGYRPVAYAVGCVNGGAKDLTGRYAPAALGRDRGRDAAWWTRALVPLRAAEQAIAAWAAGTAVRGRAEVAGVARSDAGLVGEDASAWAALPTAAGGDRLATTSPPLLLGSPSPPPLPAIPSDAPQSSGEPAGGPRISDPAVPAAPRPPRSGRAPSPVPPQPAPAGPESPPPAAPAAQVRPPSGNSVEADEDAELVLRVESAASIPPTTIAGFRDHPTYALPRHLPLRWTVLPGIEPAGFHKGEAYYLRIHLAELKTPVAWRREGKRIKTGELPARLLRGRGGVAAAVRAGLPLGDDADGISDGDGGGSGGRDDGDGGGSDGRGDGDGGGGDAPPGWGREGKGSRLASATRGAPPPRSLSILTERQARSLPPKSTTELFGIWQVEDAEAETAVGGRVPRNEHGNVELPPLVPSLPVGTSHLDLPGIGRTCARMGVDAAPALRGFEHRGVRSVPVFAGVVICSQDVPLVVERYLQEERARVRAEHDARAQAARGAWARLLRALLQRARLALAPDDPTPGGADAEAARAVLAAAAAAGLGGDRRRPGDTERTLRGASAAPSSAVVATPAAAATPSPVPPRRGSPAPGPAEGSDVEEI